MDSIRFDWIPQRKSQSHVLFPTNQPNKQTNVHSLHELFREVEVAAVSNFASGGKDREVEVPLETPAPDDASIGISNVREATSDSLHNNHNNNNNNNNKS